MPRFRYQAVEAGGGVVRGAEDAASEQALLSSLKARNLTVFAVEKRERRLELPSRLSSFLRNAAAERLAFFQELSSLASAGLTAEESLAIIADMPDGGAAAILAGKLRGELRSGANLATSLQIDGQLFPDHLRALVEAGEASGSLPKVLERITTDLRRQADLRAQIASALVYPILLMVVLFGVLGLVLFFVVPAFDEVFAGYEGELPLATTLLLSLSRRLTDQPYSLLAFFLCTTGAVYFVLARPSVHNMFQSLWLRPATAFGLGQKLASANLTRILSLLLSNGVPLAQALRLTAPTFAGSPLGPSLEQTAQRVREGVSLASALREDARWPPTVLRITAIGEETGRLAPLLEQLAIKFEQDANAIVGRLVALTVPMLTLFMGALVAVVVGAILSGIMSLQRQMI